MGGRMFRFRNLGGVSMNSALFIHLGHKVIRQLRSFPCHLPSTLQNVKGTMHINLVKIPKFQIQLSTVIFQQLLYIRNAIHFYSFI